MFPCCFSAPCARDCPENWFDRVPWDLQSVNKKGLRVELLGKENMDEAVTVMRDAFNGTDSTDPEPCMDWMVGAELSEKWTDPRRLRFFTWVQKWCFVTAVDNGGLVLGARSTRRDNRGALLAVCVVLPPGLAHLAGASMTSLATWRTWAQMPGSSPGGDRLASRRMAEVGRILAQAHAAHAKVDHFYVWSVAVSPAAQGRGCCSALLDVVAWLADDSHKLVYLETCGKRNAGLYKRFDYNVVGQYSCSLDKDDELSVPITAMTREPKIPGRFVDLKSPFEMHVMEIERNLSSNVVHL